MAADSNIELHRALKLFAKYKKRGSGEGYQDWIVKNNYINDNDTLDRTKMMFDMNDLRLNRKYLVKANTMKLECATSFLVTALYLLVEKLIEIFLFDIS